MVVTSQTILVKSFIRLLLFHLCESIEWFASILSLEFNDRGHSKIPVRAVRYNRKSGPQPPYLSFKSPSLQSSDTTPDVTILIDFIQPGILYPWFWITWFWILPPHLLVEGKSSICRLQVSYMGRTNRQAWASTDDLFGIFSLLKSKGPKWRYDSKSRGNTDSSPGMTTKLSKFDTYDTEHVRIDHWLSLLNSSLIVYSKSTLR